MYIFLPDSPVTAKGLTLREKKVVVERLRGNQTGIENKHLKAYQVKEAFCDVKLYLFFLLGVVCNIPNGGMLSRFNLPTATTPFSNSKT